MRLSWRFGIIAGIFLAIFTLYPQFKMWYIRGNEWQGHYAYNDIDEVAYASYLRALIDGRPRKNDPYTGRDHTAENPQPESLFSIQFMAPYTVALPARILGIGTPWAMTIGGGLAGFLAALAVFWVIGSVTGNSWYGMAGSLVVLAGGALAAGEGAIGGIFEIGQTYPYFPGFRRYIPAVAIPFFFAMCGLVWKLVTTEEMRKRRLYCILASLCFAFTVFSYFYIWTTAAAWLGAVVLIWLLVRPEGFRADLKAFLALGLACGLSLIPYAILLSNRVETMDHVQLLVRTHAIDIVRVPVFISFAVIAMLAGALTLRVIGLRDRATLFALSLALVPIIVFNQQVITGRSLQPIHYQVFIGNYVAALALIVTIGILCRNIWENRPVVSKAVLTAVTVVAIAWGFVECHYTVEVLDWANEQRDKQIPVARRLEELARTDPAPHQTTVLHYGLLESDDLPTIVPQNVLWARHQHVFAGLSWEESKERYYQFLYYRNVDERGLDYLIKNDFVTMIALFGWGRHTDRLSSEYKPLTYGEIAAEVARYGQYIRTFDARRAAEPKVSYVVKGAEDEIDMTNLDRWYRRDEGERIGEYIFYRVTPRATP